MQFLVVVNKDRNSMESFDFPKELESKRGSELELEYYERVLAGELGIRIKIYKIQ